MNWQDKIEVKKGNAGEKEVRKFLAEKGLIIYEPVTNIAHGFDKLISKGKQQFVIVEVKTKPKRIYYPDTGFNIKHYNEYKFISVKHNLPVFIFFVDEILKEIYGNYLHELEIKKQINWHGKIIEYPKEEGGIIFFYQPAMRKISVLNDELADEINSMSTRKYIYPLSESKFKV